MMNEPDTEAGQWESGVTFATRKLENAGYVGGNTLEDLTAQLMQYPEYRAEHERQKPYYDTVVAMCNLKGRYGRRWPLYLLRALLRAIWETR